MIQGEALRVKALRSAVEHREELSRLGEARARERQAREVTQKSEAVFWREISRAAQGQSGHASKAPALDQAREAGRLVGLAKERMGASEQALMRQVGRALRLQARCKSLAALQRRERTTRLHQREERLGEDIHEMISSRSRRVEPRVAREKTCAAEQSLDQSKGLQLMPRGDFTVGNFVPQPRDCSGEAPAVSLPRPLLTPRVFEVTATQGGSELRVVGETAGAPIQCRVIDQPGAEVHVVVESSAPEVSTLSLSSRLALADRLRAAGVHVRRLEFKRESPDRGLDGGYLRKKPRMMEEGDETCIA